MLVLAQVLHHRVMEEHGQCRLNRRNRCCWKDDSARALLTLLVARVKADSKDATALIRIGLIKGLKMHILASLISTKRKQHHRGEITVVLHQQQLSSPDFMKHPHLSHPLAYVRGRRNSVVLLMTMEVVIVSKASYHFRPLRVIALKNWRDFHVQFALLHRATMMMRARRADSLCLPHRQCFTILYLAEQCRRS